VTRLSLQPVRLPLGDDTEGRLVFADDVLVAVLVRLSELHGEAGGSWFLETSFGPAVGQPEHPTFSSLANAEDWLRERMPGWASPSA
jgi:hypothetical protein